MADENGGSAKETAKAVQEVAKATSDVIKLTTKFSVFLGQIFGPAIKDIGEVAYLKTQYWKLKNALKFQDKVEQLLQEHDVQNIEFVNARIGIPLIEAAVHEDHDELQKLWAMLMVSTISKNNLFSAQRAHIETLKQLEPKDAQTLTLLNTFFIRTLEGNNPRNLSWQHPHGASY